MPNNILNSEKFTSLLNSMLFELVKSYQNYTNMKYGNSESSMPKKFKISIKISDMVMFFF